MKRLLFVVAIAVFAVSAMLTPSAPAQAGFKGRLAVGLALGALAHSHQRYEHRRVKKKRYHARRKTTKKVYATKKSKPSTTKVAKAEPAPLPEVKDETIDTIVENENSSISTAALAPVEETASIDGTEADASEPVEVAAEPSETKPADGPKSANKLDCKKFFPSVGMTLSVSCE
jgi:hypothetical protein